MSKSARNLLTHWLPRLRCLALGTCLAAFGCNGDLKMYFEADVVETTKDVAYVEGSDNPRQLLDVYAPRGASNFPVVVFVHGGYWIGQDKDYYAPILGLYGNVGRALAKRGIGCVVINYRLVPDVGFEEQVSDVSAAVRWTRDNIERYGGNPEQIVLGGHSAGGHLTALLALDETRLQAAGVNPGTIRGFAPLSPIFDLEDMAEHPPDADFNERVTQKVFGTDLKKHSPSTYFQRIDAPLFVAMGEHDENYLVAQIPRAVSELEALGVQLSFAQLPDHSHSDVVLNFDSGSDRLSAPLVEFVQRAVR